MRRALPFCLVAFAGAIVFAQSRHTAAPDSVVRSVYFTPETGEIRLLGVCDVRSDSIRCWGPDRQANAELTMQVGNALKGFDSGNGANVPFLFGRKNRLAIFHTTVEAMAPGSPSLVRRIYVAGSRFGYYAEAFAVRDGTFLFHFVPIEAEPSAATADAFADVVLQPWRPFEIPLKEGATASYMGLSATIESIEAKKPDPPRRISSKSAQVDGLIDRSRQPKTWTVRLKLGGIGPSDKIILSLTPLDKLGVPIRYFDWSGRPVAKPATVFDSGWGGFDAGSSFALPDDSQNDSARETVSWRLAVDPAFVSSLRFTVRYPKTVEFKDIPLDPLPASGGRK